MSGQRFADVEPLAAHHVLEGFDCGIPSLNGWLIAHALPAGGVGSARTFVVVDAEQQRVVGYHAITAAAVAPDEATERAKKGMPLHPIPAVLLARLAVDESVQGRGVGAYLLKDAMTRALAAAEIMGIRVLLVHALDEKAKAFYARFGFETSPTDDLNLQMLTKDLRKSVDEA